jgi:hypothetical protein
MIDCDAIEPRIYGFGLHRAATGWINSGCIGYWDYWNILDSDLVQEANFLSLLQHPNVSSSMGYLLMTSWTSSRNPRDISWLLTGYMKLWLTGLKNGRGLQCLDEEAWTWSKLRSQITHVVSKYGEKNDSKINKYGLLSEQLEFCKLQQQWCICTTKPANIGFDVRGDVKPFQLWPSKNDTSQRRFLHWCVQNEWRRISKVYGSRSTGQRATPQSESWCLVLCCGKYLRWSNLCLRKE